MTQEDILRYQNLRTKLGRACHRYFEQKLKKNEERFIDWNLVLDTLVITYSDDDIHHIKIDLEEFLNFTETL